MGDDSLEGELVDYRPVISSITKTFGTPLALRY